MRSLHGLIYMQVKLFFFYYYLFNQKTKINYSIMTYLIKANLCTCKWSTIRIYKSNSLIKRYFLYLEETTQVQIAYIKRNIFYN